MDNLPVEINKLKEFILIGREKLNVYRSKLRVINRIPVATAIRKQTLQDGQDAGAALLWAEAKLGELLKAIPDKKATSGGGSRSLPEGITHKQSSFAQSLAEHKDLIDETVKDAVENEDIPTRTEVLRKAKDRQKEERMKTEMDGRKKQVSKYEIRKGDFKKVLADVTKIDAIITDPPYPKEYIKCFSDLSKFASDKLKPDGFLATYSGQYNMPEVIERLSENLTYIWTFCLYHVGKKQLVNYPNVMCGWKPILVFGKKKMKFKFSAYDVLISEAREKHSHKWQQSESGVAQLVDIFSSPGDLVVDPFAGSGTFIKVANEMGRRAVGAEID